MAMVPGKATTAKAPAAPTGTLKHLAAALAETRFRRQYRQALEERRAYPNRRPRHPSGAQARRPHGPQPGNGRSDPDQGEQEGRLPRVEGIERVGLTFQTGPSGE
jgi:hypothetical protein